MSQRGNGWKVELLDTLTRNPWFGVLLQKVTQPDGSSGPYYTIDFPHRAVGVVVRRGDEFLFIRQYRFIVDALRTASLPIFAPRLDVQLCRDALVEARRHRGGSMNLVVPAGFGRVVFLKDSEDLPDCVLEESLASLSTYAAGLS